MYRTYSLIKKALGANTSPEIVSIVDQSIVEQWSLLKTGTMGTLGADDGDDDEIAMILSAFEHRLRAGFSLTLYKQIQPLSRIQTLNGRRVRGISPVGKEKVYGEKNLPKSQVFSSE